MSEQPSSNEQLQDGWTPRPCCCANKGINFMAHFLKTHIREGNWTPMFAAAADEIERLQRELGRATSALVRNGLGLDEDTAHEPGTAPQYKAMFDAAVSTLAEISRFLCIPDDVASCSNGAEEIIDAIAELKERLDGTSQGTEARHLLSCSMVKHPNCTHCDCGSSIDTESHSGRSWPGDKSACLPADHSRHREAGSIQSTHSDSKSEMAGQRVGSNTASEVRASLEQTIEAKDVDPALSSPSPPPSDDTGLLVDLLEQCRDFLYDDSGTPIASMELRERVRAAIARHNTSTKPAVPAVVFEKGIELCCDCPAPDYPTNTTRCDECPRRSLGE